MLKPARDAQWVEMDIKVVQGEGLDWSAVLDTIDGETVQIGLTPAQVTYLVPALKGIAEDFLFCTPYQMINRVAQLFGCHPTCVVLDTNLDQIVAGQIEMVKNGKERFFLRMSAGDCLVFATMHGLKIYMTKQVVSFLT